MLRHRLGKTEKESAIDEGNDPYRTPGKQAPRKSLMERLREIKNRKELHAEEQARLARRRMLSYWSAIEDHIVKSYESGGSMIELAPLLPDDISPSDINAIRNIAKESGIVVEYGRLNIDSEYGLVASFYEWSIK